MKLRECPAEWETAAGLRSSAARAVLRLISVNQVVLKYYDHKRKQYHLGSQDFPIPNGERPISELLPSQKFSLGWFMDAHLASIYDFLLDVHEKKQCSASFEDAVKAQEILEAAYLSADRNSKKITLPLP